MTLFDECKEALADDFSFLSQSQEKKVLEDFYTYPFEYGSINKSNKDFLPLELNKLIELIDKDSVSSDVYVLADMQGVPIFRTNLLLALNKIDDISCLSTKVFLLGDGYLAQIVSKYPPLDIITSLNGRISKLLD